VPAQKEVLAKEASQGEKMIEIKLRFWTDGLAEKGKVLPKHAWSAGVAGIERNKTHGFESSTLKHFHSLLDIGQVIEAMLMEQGITLHTSKKMKKYFRA
jgi:hypothetical protein